MNQIGYEQRAKIYKDALDTFGTGAQLLKALEELTELQLEIHRAADGRVNLGGLIEELADVTIMVEQLRQIFGVNDQVCKVMDYKVARLQQRIEDRRQGRPDPDLSILDDIFGKYNIQPGGDLKVDDEGRSGGAAAPCGG